ncbi:MAG TPA: sigma-70 family RNA polymerase sigma factor [Kofleriaceae bacterium]|nr:sigma-70 family RNA polymerase sigma factor [Kofleriaceae bacterium]
MEGKVLSLVRPLPAGAERPLEGRDDDELMLLARGGRAAAFDELVRRHQAAAMGVAYRYLGHREAAQDAAQNAFIEVFRRVGDYESQGKFRAYFHRVLLNQCKMSSRSRRTRLRHEERLAREEDGGGHAPIADEQILERERDRRVEQAVLRLSDKLRAVTALHFSAGMSHAEIAEVLRIPAGTVKSRLSAALVALRDLLSEEAR